MDVCCYVFVFLQSFAFSRLAFCKFPFFSVCLQGFFQCVQIFNLHETFTTAMQVWCKFHWKFQQTFIKLSLHQCKFVESLMKLVSRQCKFHESCTDWVKALVNCHCESESLNQSFTKLALGAVQVSCKLAPNLHGRKLLYGKIVEISFR